MDMVAQVKGEVRKLCTKSNVAAQIVVNDKVDELRSNIERMIYLDPELKVWVDAIQLFFILASQKNGKGLNKNHLCTSFRCQGCISWFAAQIAAQIAQVVQPMQLMVFKWGRHFGQQ